MRPLVDRLLTEGGDPEAVAKHLREEASLEKRSRRAALRVLLARCQEAHH